MLVDGRRATGLVVVVAVGGRLVEDRAAGCKSVAAGNLDDLVELLVAHFGNQVEATTVGGVADMLMILY